MTIEPTKFRQALSKFASGVTVISTLSKDHRPIGVTVSAFTSLSLSPPLILICLDEATSQLSAYIEGNAFCVNILAKGQEAISNGFAYPGPNPPFDTVPYEKGTIGLPVITGTSANLECRREAVYPGGDHHIIVGKVVNVVCSDDKEPLIYTAGKYRTLASADLVE